MSEQLFGKTSLRVVQLFVLVVLVCVVVLLLPTKKTVPASMARLLKSNAQARSLTQGVVVFAGNNEDLFPTAEEWPDALVEHGYIEPEQLVSGVEDGDGVSYIYVPSSHKLFDGDFENRIVIYEDPKHFEEGVVVGFADAHVEVIEHEDFERMLAQQLASEPMSLDEESP